jgi:hypothetical protein
MFRSLTRALALLSLSVWLGGLVTLGGLVAPVVFTHVSMPASADTMTVIFRRFDLVAMACAALLLATEAARAFARLPFAWWHHVRASASVLAAAAAVYEGVSLSPRIAALHAAGAIRGLGEAGIELARLHDRAELLGKTEAGLLLLLVLIHAAFVSDPN